uniref:TSC22 domain family protein 1-like isoform X2 n=1 Tax=Oncorhynchus gorbuscha TaxID=8017 RepID=UPI001EAF8334|nr:TSC22 domain family protein 1-like isoform X2 [Oncorhynchus gorbuscha]
MHWRSTQRLKTYIHSLGLSPHLHQCSPDWWNSKGIYSDFKREKGTEGLENRNISDSIGGELTDSPMRELVVRDEMAMKLLFRELEQHLKSSSGASVVAIDNKIEQAMDLVKSHLMYAVREEVEVLKEQIKELIERNSQLEQENSLLKTLASPEQMAQFQAQTQAGSPPTSTQPPTQTQAPALPPTQLQPTSHNSGPSA